MDQRFVSKQNEQMAAKIAKLKEDWLKEHKENDDDPDDFIIFGMEDIFLKPKQTYE